MKKLLTLIATALLLSSASAQVGNSFSENTFFSFGGGYTNYHASLYGGTDTCVSGFNVSLGYGKWILSPLAFRLAVDAVMAPTFSNSASDGMGLFAYASAEFAIDPAPFFVNYNLRSKIPYLLIGLGVVTREFQDNDFQASLGFHWPFSVGDKWALFLQGKFFFNSQAFDNVKGSDMMMNFSLGATRRFFDDSYHRRPPYESKGPGDDWFLGYGLGPNHSYFGGEHIGKFGMYGVAPEIMFGRNFSNFWTIRFEATGLFGHERYDTVADEPGEAYKFTMVHADLMLNLTHAARFTRGVRWNIMPYLGAGPIWRYDEPKFTMAADYGVMFRYYIDAMGDFFIDYKHIMMPPRVANVSNCDYLFGILGTGFLSVTIGYIHNFGDSRMRYRMPVNWSNTEDCNIMMRR